MLRGSTLLVWLPKGQPSLFKGFSNAGLDHLKSVTAQPVKTP